MVLLQPSRRLGQIVQGLSHCVYLYTILRRADEAIIVNGAYSSIRAFCNQQFLS